MNGRSKKVVACELLSFFIAQIPLYIAWTFNAEWMGIAILLILIADEVFFMICDLSLWKQKLLKIDVFCVVRCLIICYLIWFFIKRIILGRL